MNYRIVTTPHYTLDHNVTNKAQRLVDKNLGRNYFNAQINIADKVWFVLDGSNVIGFASVVLYEDYGLLKTSVVESSHRGKGIGTRLVETRVNYLIQNGCPLIRSNAWIVNGVCNAEKTLVRNGFTAVKDIEGFYSDCYDDFNPCCICGSECGCFARIFERKINLSY